ncbi:MAG: PepSY domain-containing protein [Lachnospiraceae bacterium]|nr:PepSY domain-containing protein [Lachnospiraceae bacterium]
MTNNIMNHLKATGRTILSMTCIAALLAFAPTGIAFAEEAGRSVSSADTGTESIAEEGTSRSDSAAAETASGSVIGAEAARNYAFADAGIDPADAEALFTEFDQEDGQFLYDVDFTMDGTEYEYHIDAYDGSVLQKSVEYVSLKASLAASVTSGSSITSDEAKEIALAHTGLSEEELALVTFTKEKSDQDDSLAVYEFEFSSESRKYEYEISSETGDILDFSVEVLPGASQNSGNETTGTETNADSANAGSATESSDSPNASADSGSSGTNISLDEAKAIALEKAGLSEADVTFKKAKLDKEDGIMVYEIEFYQGQMEYECEINAVTGAMIEFEAEYDD